MFSVLISRAAGLSDSLPFRMESPFETAFKMWLMLTELSSLLLSLKSSLSAGLSLPNYRRTSSVILCTSLATFANWFKVGAEGLVGAAVVSAGGSTVRFIGERAWTKEGRVTIEEKCKSLVIPLEDDPLTM